MIERKPHKFSKKTSERNSRNPRDRESFISSVTKQEEKSAAETASSILEELGVKKSDSKKTKTNYHRSAQIKDTKKKNLSEDLEQRGLSILKDLKREKIENNSQTIYSKEKKKNDPDFNKKEDKKTWGYKNKAEKKSNKEIDKFGFHEMFIYFTIFCLIGVSILAYVGGYIKFNLAGFPQFFSSSSNKLEFLGEFNARQVENGYNRIPLFVVEGKIRNSFSDSDNINKIQLKAFAFDHEQRLIDTHFTFSGIVLSDEQLETLSPIYIKAIRQTGDLSILDSSLGKKVIENDLIGKKSFEKQEIPFQVVFFKDVSTIKSTSIEVVSYLLNDNLVFLGTQNRD